MDTTDYKKLKLQEIENYKNILYENYKDQVKTTNAYIVGLSSSAILAFFILIYKISLEENILLLLKISTRLLLFSLITIIVTNFIYSIDSSNNEQKYADLYHRIQQLNKDSEISKQIDMHYERITKSFFYTLMAGLRYLAYFSFIGAISLIGYLIFSFTKATT